MTDESDAGVLRDCRTNCSRISLVARGSWYGQVKTPKRASAPTTYLTLTPPSPPSLTPAPPPSLTLRFRPPRWYPFMVEMAAAAASG
eukprot:182708-Prorocentrum_minimum.AAC.1